MALICAHLILMGTYRFDHVDEPVNYIESLKKYRSPDENKSPVICPSNITSPPELIAGQLHINQPLPNVFENTTNRNSTNYNTPWSDQSLPDPKATASTVPPNPQKLADYQNANHTADQNASHSGTYEHYNGTNTSHPSKSHPMYGQPLYNQHQNTERNHSTEKTKQSGFTPVQSHQPS